MRYAYWTSTKTVPNWPSPSTAPPASTSATPHQLPGNGIRSSRSFCCQIRNAVIGGINRPWLYSAESTHQPHICRIPSQNGTRLRSPTAATASAKPQEKRQTGVETALEPIGCADIEESPRLGWRGVFLDSANLFQRGDIAALPASYAGRPFKRIAATAANRRRSGDDRPRCDVARHRRTGADDRAFADPHAGAHEHVRRHPSLRFDDDRRRDQRHRGIAVVVT